jgi:predicted enzyme involved in methoxymalonyl-ACP biosynthesis
MEDRDRTRMYVSECERQYSRKAIGSLENWLKTLQTKVAVEELNDTNLSRVIQLFNKPIK